MAGLKKKEAGSLRRLNSRTTAVRQSSGFNSPTYGLTSAISGHPSPSYYPEV
jgi:hypothetical protein